MLQKEVLSRETFQLLEKIMLDSNLKSFNLAGGTALALYLGHRKSIDLDLFTQEDFNSSKIESYLIEEYGFISDYKDKNTLKGTINNVKIDCITSKSKLCKPLREFNKIRLYDTADISAMKLLAILDNGSRLKDFIDIAYLSTRYTLNEMLNFAQEKFPNKNKVMFEKALLYFNDIIDDEIEMLLGDYNWKAISERIEEMVQYKGVVFDNEPAQSENRHIRIKR